MAREHRRFVSGRDVKRKRREKRWLVGKRPLGSSRRRGNGSFEMGLGGKNMQGC